MANKPRSKNTVRISLTISIELHDIFKELSLLTGKSIAHMPAYLLEESKPTFQSLVDVFTVATEDEAMALSLLRENVESSMVKAAKFIIHD